MSQGQKGPATRPAVPRGVAVILLVLMSVLAVSVGGVSHRSTPAGSLELASSPVTITEFSFQPPNVNPGQQVTGTVDLTGGTTPYHLWFNNTPPGCSPSNNPETTSLTTFTFGCNPSSTGSFSVHLDVVDSSTPVTKASQAASLNVSNGNNGNGNGNGNGSNSKNGNNSLGSIIPSGFLTIGLILVLVLMGAIIAIAAGVVALSVLVPRRLRQLNETLAKTGLPPKEPKPPT